MLKLLLVRKARDLKVRDLERVLIGELMVTVGYTSKVYRLPQVGLGRESAEGYVEARP